MTTLTLKYDSKTNWVEFYFPYHSKFVQYLQYKLPKDQRKYNPNRRLWTVSTRSLTRVVRYGSWCFDRLCADDLPEKWKRILKKEVAWGKMPNNFDQLDTTGANSDLYAILHLLPTAPISLVEKTFKHLATLYHPDHGGDENDFRRIREAYDGIRELQDA